MSEVKLFDFIPFNPLFKDTYFYNISQNISQFQALYLAILVAG